MRKVVFTYLRPRLTAVLCESAGTLSPDPIKSATLRKLSSSSHAFKSLKMARHAIFCSAKMMQDQPSDVFESAVLCACTGMRPLIPAPMAHKISA